MDAAVPADSLNAAAIADRAAPDRAREGPGAAARAAARAGLYVHVPFCAVRCDYCDFASGHASREAVGRWLRGIEREAALRAPGARDLVFTSVFFGGGTPSALPARHVAGVLGTLARHFTIAAGAEITLEANPESAGERSLAAWRAAGVNRLSLGAQSFVPDELERLGRLHDAAAPGRVLARAAALGFERRSLDLMFGFPGQRAETWRATLETALALDVEHLSAYAFIAEPGTPLGNAVLRGERALPSAEAQADAYAELEARAAEAGLFNYETSNFSRPDAECRHNLVYWLRRPCVALGPSAHGFAGGVRYANPYALERWAAPLERGARPEDSAEPETPERAAQEMLLLGLRLARGLALADHPPFAREAFAARYGRAIEAAVRAGRIEATADGVRVPARFRFVADDAIAWIEARAAGLTARSAPA